MLESDAAPKPPAVAAASAPARRRPLPIRSSKIRECRRRRRRFAQGHHARHDRQDPRRRHESAIEVITKAPNKRVSISQMGSSASYTAFDGTAGWMGNAGRPARE